MASARRTTVYTNSTPRRKKDFAVILEQDKGVVKWLRPAQNQFRIYWQNNSKLYHPDFISETEHGDLHDRDEKEMDMDTAMVQEKARAAEQYCRAATEFTFRNGGKPWTYILIPPQCRVLQYGV